MAKYFRSNTLYISGVITVCVCLANMWLYGDERASFNDHDLSANKLSEDKLIEECGLVSPGMTLQKVDEIITSRNRKTKMTNKKGGNVKYWISRSVAELIPVGNVCVVMYDRGGNVSYVEVRLIHRSK